MKTIGLIGGMTWHSTAEYYRIINEQANERLGGLHSGQILLHSVDFAEFQPPLNPKDWPPVEKKLSDIAQRIERAGAACLLFCANTTHMAAEAVQKSIHIPILHIAEMTAKAVLKQNLKSVTLLGTRVTMEQPFFKDRLSRMGIKVVIPVEEDRAFIHATIFDELGKGIFKPETKNRYLDIIEGLGRKGTEGTIFACTEIPLLLQQKDCSRPVFDTIMIHASAAVDFALSDENLRPSSAL